MLVLQPNQGAHFQRSFFAAMAGRDSPPRPKRCVIGRSISANLHAVAAQAIAELVHRHTGEPPIGAPAPQGRLDAGGHSLANWLAEVTSDPRYNLFKQLPYLFTSGALRARAIATALKHVQHRPFERAIDVGSGVGVIPWLLRHDMPSLREVELVEPKTQFRAAADRLWRDFPGTYSVVDATAEQADYRTADLVMFSHCLLLVARDQRRAVLGRAWDTLRPGGVLLVNENFRDRKTNFQSLELVRRDELIQLLPSDARIFTRQTGWRTPEMLDAVTTRATGHTGVIVAVRQ